MPEKNGDHPISILLIIIHGLIRARDLELGRDADTGGQTKYVAGFGSDPSNLFLDSSANHFRLASSFR